MENLENIIRDKTGVEKEIELGGCSRIRSRKQNQSHSCSVICRFNLFKDRQNSLGKAEKSKNTGVYI